MKRLGLIAGFSLLLFFMCYEIGDITRTYVNSYTKLPLIGPSLVNAQAPGANVVYQQILTGANTGPSNNVRNIGQSMHSVTVQFVNATAHTCSNPTLTLGFENSSDSAHYSPLGSVVIVKGNSDLALTPVHLVAYGAYPYIRVNYISGDTTNCRINAFYTGTIYPIGVNGANTYPNSSYVTQASTSLAGSRTAVIIPRMTGYRFVLYGITLESNSTLATYTLTEDSSVTPGTCGTPSGTISNIMIVTTTTPVPAIWPVSSSPIYIADRPATDFCVAIATAGADINNVLVTFRYE